MTSFFFRHTNIDFIRLHSRLAHAGAVNHEVHGRFKRTRIFMVPAQPGKGLKCHHIISKICELAGIHDITANVLGSQNPMNVLRATFEVASHMFVSTLQC